MLEIEKVTDTAIPAPKRAPRRYSAEPLPPYRYVPGGPFPHPVTSPQGHFFPSKAGAAGRRSLKASETLSPLAWMVEPLWLYGVDLFNQRYLWEAHEVWEPLWKALDKAEPPGLFLQGLMQCAGGLLKVHAGELEGVQAFWGQAEVRLGKAQQVAPELWGLKTRKVFKDFSAYFKGAASKGALPALDRRVPTLKLAM